MGRRRRDGGAQRHLRDHRRVKPVARGQAYRGDGCVGTVEGYGRLRLGGSPVVGACSSSRLWWLPTSSNLIFLTDGAVSLPDTFDRLRRRWLKGNRYGEAVVQQLV